MDLFEPHQTRQVLDAFSTEIVRSHDSFEKFFAEAERLKAITFCESPGVLLNLLDEHELEDLVVMVGDRSDYRQDLSEDDFTVVERLEALRREGRLRIYMKGGSKVVHAKMYLIEKPGGAATVLVGSANLTKTGWGYQENYLAVFETATGSALYEQFEEDFWAQVEDYGAPFLKDLSGRVESTETEEERRDVIKRWLAGGRTEKSPIEEIAARATSQMAGRLGDEDDGSDEDTAGGAEEQPKIRLSLRSYEGSEAEHLREGFKQSGGQVSGETARISPGGFSSWLVREGGVPPLWVEDGRVQFAAPGARAMTLSTEALPGAETVDAALASLERYVGSVDAPFAQTREAEAVKAQMVEALFYFMWAPFVNEHARLFRSSGVEDFGKQLPFLYIWGESNSGKGTLAGYGLRLVSGGRVTRPLDGSDLGVQAIRKLRHVNSAFPVVFDDAEARRIKQASPLRNYWASWETERRFPTVVFVSNDNRPPGWFQNRAKILQFSVYFEETPEAQMRLSELTSGWPRLFAWTSGKVGRRFREGAVDPREGDVLLPVREAVRSLYEHAGRLVPAYLPLQAPAEVEHDLDRAQWRRFWRSGAFEVQRRDGDLYLAFDANRFDSTELYGPHKRLPQRIRAEKRGTTIVVPHPEAFWAWMDVEEPGLWGKAKRLAGL